MQILIILLKTNWQSWINSTRYGTEERPKRIVEIIGFAVLIAALYLMGEAMLNQFGHVYVPKVLQAISIFMAFGVFILAKDAMEGSLKRFYEAPDISLLLSMPLSPTTIFGFKFIQLIAANLLSMFIWLIPPWIAFGQIFNLPWHFYLALIPTCFCLLIITMGQITVGMMILVRFFSSRWMIRILKTLSVVIGIVAGLLLSMSLVAFDRSDDIARFIFNQIKVPNYNWYPHLWAAKFLISWLPESNIQGAQWAFRLIGASIGIPVIGIMLASKIYYRSWEYAKRVQLNTNRKRKKSTGFSPMGRGRIRSMMAKDFRVFIRHRGRATVIIMLTLIILIMLIKASYDMRMGRVGEETDFTLFTLGLQIMIYSVMITLGLTWGGFKAEINTWWILKSGPITPELLFKGKFLTATFCSVTYTNFWVLFVLILFGGTDQLWPLILLSTTLITATTIAFNTAIGTLPWVAEIEQENGETGKRPILRIATIFVTIIVNAILLIFPTFILLKIDLVDDVLIEVFHPLSLSMVQYAMIATTLGFLVGVWGISYLLGKHSLRKLLS